jgi:hypothetical protein
MKRLFLFVFVSLAVSYGAVAQQDTFTWSGTHTYVDPSDTPPKIDALNFIIAPGAQFGVDLTVDQQFNTFPFTTSDTLNVTNFGKLTGIPGFDFLYNPSSPIPPQPGVPFSNMAGTFANIANGLGGGAILCTNIFGGLNEFQLFGQFFGGGAGVVLPSQIPGLAVVRIAATNVIDSGLISMDNTGLIDIKGNDVDLTRGQFVMSGEGSSTFGVDALDWGSGLFGDTNNFAWSPFRQLTSTTATSAPFFSSATGFILQMSLTNATPYFESQNPAPDANGLIVWRGIYLQDSSPSNVLKEVHFEFNPSLGGGEFHIQWSGTYRDPMTGNIATNYLILTDDPTIRRNTNFFRANPPNDFSIIESPTNITFFTPPATPGYINPAPPGVVSNDFSYISDRPTAVLVDTNVVFGGSPTNLPGRIQIAAYHSLNLAHTHVSGPNYLSLTSTNDFLGNGNSSIASPYTDLNLGVASGFLVLSNLLIPGLPAWTGVPGAPNAVPGSPMGGIQAWSASYFFLDSNGFTNEVRMLLVNSALQPITPTLQQDVILHSKNSLVVGDSLNIIRHFFSDATALTVTTNANSAFSLVGQINLLSPDIFWSTALPNLQFLTNYGIISSLNLAVFAGDLSDPYSDPNSARPYQAFVNDGTIINQGTLIRADWFENNGRIAEDNGGSIDIKATTAIATNGSFIAPLGTVSISANSLLASNGVIEAGGPLSLAMSCFLSDGYVFGNQFGHITNSVLPNVVTNGNTWITSGGIQVSTKPATGDLLGTSITNLAVNNLNSTTVWPGKDLGASPEGYADNLALGRLILNADNTGSQFTFRSVNGSSALYVDSIELQGNTTNTDANGNPQSIAIEPGMNIYYAQAIENGVSIAEKLNGKFGAAYTNGGQFFWVSNYAGVYSSTNIAYPDGNSHIFNQALVISPDIDSDGDGTVNRDDETPIPIGTVFDINITGPLPCDGGNGQGYGNGTNGTGPTSGPVKPPGSLAFPVPSSGSANLWFRLAAGSYNGLFYDTNGVNPVSSGSFRANVTARGGLTAKLVLGGHTYSFSKPPFDSSGHFSGTVSTRGVAGSLKVDLQLVNNDHIVGQVSGDGWVAQLLAYRAAFSSRNKAPWAGNDTLLLATVDTNSTAQAGDSFGTVKISSAGTVQWSGMLPDGTKVSQKSTLSKNGIWPLYYPANDGAGCLIGWMQCTNDSDITGSGVWVVPAAPGGLYPQGLTNELNATGSRASGSLGAHASVTAVISGAPLASAVTNSVIISGKNSQSADGRLKISANLKTGLFTGSVTDPNSSQTLSFQGALLEQSGIGGGFFLNTDKSQGGKVHLTPAN